MQIIWYNSVLGEYEFGDTENYKEAQSKFENEKGLTVLMELPLGDQSLAYKVISELNVANNLQNAVF